MSLLLKGNKIERFINFKFVEKLKKMTGKQPTARDVAISTLENKVLQGVLGSNQIMKNQAEYGKLAVNGTENTYNETMNKKEVQEFKDVLYKEKKKEFDKYDVFGFPSINDSDVSLAIIRQIEENKKMLPLKDLEKIVKNLGEGYDFKLSKEIENYVPAELEEKIQVAAIEAAKKRKKISPEDVLDEKEKYAWDVYQFLSQSYNRGVALGTGNYFADLNELGRQIIEKYEPKEEREE